MTKNARTAVDLRAQELDTIAAVLPIERRDELAELLSDEDVATRGIWSIRAWATTRCAR